VEVLVGSSIGPQPSLLLEAERLQVLPPYLGAECANRERDPIAAAMMASTTTASRVVTSLRAVPGR
jgi:hypothetical protein